MSFFAQEAQALSISKQAANQVAEKIWKNECAGSFEGLTTWNKGENFASLGIGHFIWYSTKSAEPFQETFPELVIFLQNEGAAVPSWLRNTPTCPWKSREEFYQNIQSPKMIELRQFLFETKNLQAIFIAKRLEKALPQMVATLPTEEKINVTVIFNRLLDDSRGLYALIDYLNFKGLGISAQESYKGQGWGLLQVLQGIPPQSKDVVVDFVASAKQTLTQRVQNAPPERHEEKWLKGWLNRVNTYAEALR